METNLIFGFGLSGIWLIYSLIQVGEGIAHKEKKNVWTWALLSLSLALICMFFS